MKQDRLSNNERYEKMGGVELFGELLQAIGGLMITIAFLIVFGFIAYGVIASL